MPHTFAIPVESPGLPHGLKGMQEKEVENIKGWKVGPWTLSVTERNATGTNSW